MKITPLFSSVWILTFNFGVPAEEYYGQYVGKFRTVDHGVSGEVYAVDENKIFIKEFSYSGVAHDVYFYVGDTKQPAPGGVIVPYPADFRDRVPPGLGRFDREDVLLKLPTTLKLLNIRWLSVWSLRFTVTFGDVYIPHDLNPPKSKVLQEFRRLGHGLRSSNVTILDTKTFYIPNLHYDGQKPDAFFWVGTGPEPSVDGIKVPNELGSREKLREYLGEDIQIILPNNLTVNDIDWLAVWSVTARQNFGHVDIPKNLHVPPALGQTKITTTPATKQQFSNCIEPITGKLQIRWALDVEDVIIQMAGKVTEDQYMAFGLSPTTERSQMIGGDVVVGSYNSYDKVFQAVDYMLTSKSPCDGSGGVCPDDRIGGSNDVTLISGERKDGVTTITYRRPLVTNDTNRDINITVNSPVTIISAIGTLNNRREANYHYELRTVPTADNIQINFGVVGEDHCSSNLATRKSDQSVKPWSPIKIEGVYEFRVNIGPTGGEKGYKAITGQPSWGIAWWINGFLIPEIYVIRGQMYNFTIEGGNRTNNPAQYHPFYITSSHEGGYYQKTTAERAKQSVFAGVGFDHLSRPYPTTAGRLCEWRSKSEDKALESKTFNDYKKTLALDCEPGMPGLLTWQVPNDAPDTLYYQCYVHNNMGWKIHVLDQGSRPRRNGQIMHRLSHVSIIVISIVSLTSTEAVSW